VREAKEPEAPKDQSSVNQEPGLKPMVSNDATFGIDYTATGSIIPSFSAEPDIEWEIFDSNGNLVTSE
jgi:hypothetical protein